MKEKALNTSFDEREHELEQSHKELRDEMARVSAENEARVTTIARLEGELEKTVAALAASAKAERESTARVDALTSELERVKTALAKSTEASTLESETRAKNLESRVRDLESELKAALESYEKNESEYQKLIEEVTAQNTTLQAKHAASTDASMTTLRSQNEKLKKEVESLSTALAELEAEDSGGLFGALLGTGSSAAFKKKIKDLESVVETETAAKTALETKLRELALEHEALKAKNAPPSTLGSFFGF